jgi:hypothetical protein
MPLTENMNEQQIGEYLLYDLRVSVINDIAPCLRRRSREGGYFAVPRLTLSAVNYLAILNRISPDNYLIRFFGHLDQNYIGYGRLLWEVYRNGLIHTYEPKKLQNGNHIIDWTLYKGQRITNIDEVRICHLVPFRITNNEWTQPVSILCLYDDLIAAIEYNVELLLNNPQIENNIRNAANLLIRPEPTTEVWW